MAILAFQKPDKVVMLEANDKFGKFEFRPLEPGFGVTIGNALRRILLSSLEGYAINTIRIAGVEHEFSSVPGVKEDVTNIILNLKQVRFKQVVEEFGAGSYQWLHRSLAPKDEIRTCRTFRWPPTLRLYRVFEMLISPLI